MADPTPWIHALRTSHQRMAGLVTPLTEAEANGPAYPTEWSIAQVASHLGSQAEIFDRFLDAALTGEPAPGNDAFPPIWDRWNAKSAMEQVADSVTANEALVTRLEQLPDAQAQAFALNMFGIDLDLSGFAWFRLSEHAVHTWDIAVALDPAALVAPDAVDLLTDKLSMRVGRVGKPVAGADPIVVRTTLPDRRFRLVLDPEVAITDVDGSTDDVLAISAEAFLRLVYGRLDPDHAPADLAGDDRVELLRTVFPGF